MEPQNHRRYLSHPELNSKHRRFWKNHLLIVILAICVISKTNSGLSEPKVITCKTTEDNIKCSNSPDIALSSHFQQSNQYKNSQYIQTCPDNQLKFLEEKGRLKTENVAFYPLLSKERKSWQKGDSMKRKFSESVVSSGFKNELNPSHVDRFGKTSILKFDDINSKDLGEFLSNKNNQEADLKLGYCHPESISNNYHKSHSIGSPFKSLTRNPIFKSKHRKLNEITPIEDEKYINSITQVSQKTSPTSIERDHTYQELTENHSMKDFYIDINSIPELSDQEEDCHLLNLSHSEFQVKPISTNQNCEIFPSETQIIHKSVSNSLHSCSPLFDGECTVKRSNSSKGEKNYIMAELSEKDIPKGGTLENCLHPSVFQMNNQLKETEKGLLDIELVGITIAKPNSLKTLKEESSKSEEFPKMKSLEDLSTCKSFVKNMPKPRVPRLSFDQEVFKVEGSQGNIKIDSQRILAVIQKYERGKLILKPNEFQETGKIMRGRWTWSPHEKKYTDLKISPKERKQMIRDKQRYFHRNSCIWYNYWKDQTQIDFKEKFESRIQPCVFKKQFPYFLFHVEMILAIFSPGKERLEYENELEKASEFYLNLLKKYLDEDRKEEEKNGRFPKSSGFYKIKGNGNSALWIFLEPWIKSLFPELWHQMVNSGNKLNDQSKAVIRIFFCCSIEKVTEHYSRIMV
jgi:hypothetical protein